METVTELETWHNDSLIGLVIWSFSMAFCIAYWRNLDGVLDTPMPYFQMRLIVGFLVGYMTICLTGGVISGTLYWISDGYFTMGYRS